MVSLSDVKNGGILDGPKPVIPLLLIVTRNQLQFTTCNSLHQQLSINT